MQQALRNPVSADTVELAISTLIYCQIRAGLIGFPLRNAG